MKAEYYKWYSKEDNVEPLQGETVIVTTWYDYWNYDVGYYNKHEKEIIFQDNSICYLSSVDKWMMIKEPILKNE